MFVLLGASALLSTSLSRSDDEARYTTSLNRVDDEARYNEVLWLGTHNSAINLGTLTMGRPSAASGGRYPSEAHSAYQYIVMDQRLSVRDQLEQGVRVLDFEVAALPADWRCDSASMSSGVRCSEHVRLSGRCFRDCPFIISHGSVQQSIGLLQGYTFPETLFESVAEFVAANPTEVVTLLLMATHGNLSPSKADLSARLNSSGLLRSVWNADPFVPFTHFPTLGEMRAARRTVLIASAYGYGWGPTITSSHINGSGISGADAHCAGDTPCMEGWDAITFQDLAPANAILSQSPPRGNSTTLFVLENLSSRRGRNATSAAYWPLPNELSDAPFQAGGNPAQASLAAGYAHVRALEAQWSNLLAPYGSVVNWLLVDFFNTTTPVESRPSRTLLPNSNDGLVHAVRDINAARNMVRAHQGALVRGRPRSA